MTYLDAEQSTHNGKPVELYRYAGTYTTFRYTTAPRKISFQADDETQPYDYLPIAMKRSAVNQTTQNDDNGEVTIDLPVKTDLVSIYGFQIAPPSLELTIFRTHNLDFIRYWNGDVENISVVRGVATIRVPARLAAALNTDLPNVFFQSQCNHALYDARCDIKFEDWSDTTSITSISGKRISVQAVDSNLNGKLKGGDAILPSGERRMIVEQDGNELTINYPFSQANVEDAIILAAGCDLAWAGDCDTRFANTKRFGGFPFIPNDNVFESTLEPGKKYGGEPCLPQCMPGFEHYEFTAVNNPYEGQLGGHFNGFVMAADTTGEMEFVEFVCNDPITGKRYGTFRWNVEPENIVQQYVRLTIQGQGTGDCPATEDPVTENRWSFYQLYVQGPGWPTPRLCPPVAVSAANGAPGVVAGGIVLGLYGLFPEQMVFNFFPNYNDPGYVG